MELSRDGNLEILVAFDDFEVVAGERLPHTIDMKMPDRDIDVRVRYREVDLNIDIGDDAFVVPCPEGTRVESLLCYDELPNNDRQRAPVKWAPETDESDGK